ncbi:hypothetical protein U1839_13555 [Sphingomonas sp. RT2P30]|uniref:hypothetical protein n=1 Tax=Parasphingomonas halimpatiens TaxID=3096162 RepID=UPI002FCB0409
MRKSIGIFAACALTFAGAAALLHGQAKSQPIDGAESLDSIMIIHGKVFDHAMKPIQLTPEVVAGLQAATLRKLGATSTPLEMRSAIAFAQKFAGASAGTSGEDPMGKVVTNAARIGDLVKARPGSGDLARRNFAVLQILIGRSANVAGTNAGMMADDAATPRSLMRAVQLRDTLNTFNGGQFGGFRPGLYSYAARCAKAGVPVPPAFNSNQSTGWKKSGTLNFRILEPANLNELYTWSPTSATGNQGVCMALPISDFTWKFVPGPHPHFIRVQTYNALGIICQGISKVPNNAVSTSKACFWDNNGATTMVPGVTYPISGPTFLSPDSPLPDDNRCSDCHAGENAFITHHSSAFPSTEAVEKAKDEYNSTHAVNFTTGNNWYMPMLKTTWPHNPEPAGSYNNGNGLNTALCASCHTPSYAGRLPDVTGMVGMAARDHLSKYCLNLLTSEINSGTGAHAAGGLVGPMHGQAMANLPHTQTLLDQCRPIVAADFPGTMLPLAASAWFNF